VLDCATADLCGSCSQSERFPDIFPALAGLCVQRQVWERSQWVLDISASRSCGIVYKDRQMKEVGIIQDPIGHCMSNRITCLNRH